MPEFGSWGGVYVIWAMPERKRFFLIEVFPYDVSTLDNHHYEVFLDIVNKDLDVDLGVEGMISWSWC